MNFTKSTIPTLYKDCEFTFEKPLIFISKNPEDKDEDELWVVVPAHNICRPITPPPVKDILSNGNLVFLQSYF
jgi:hypothetical protein